MKYLILIILTLTVVNYSTGQENIIGETDKDEILQSEHSTWFKDVYNSYNPSPEITEELANIFKKNEYDVHVYFGTWCSDSQREVPKLIKLLELSEYDFENLRLVGVNRDKVIPDISEEKQKELNVFNVPTIIVYHNGEEINRFVEYAQETLEKDMLNIFSKKPYKNSYHN